LVLRFQTLSDALVDIVYVAGIELTPRIISQIEQANSSMTISSADSTISQDRPRR
jgi:hypothetical protein